MILVLCGLVFVEPLREVSITSVNVGEHVMGLVTHYLLEWMHVSNKIRVAELV